MGDLYGNKYIVDFVNSIRCGKGVLITDKFHYQGDFMNNMMHRYGNNWMMGSFYWKNGDRYEGQMKNGEMHGKGKLFYNNGNVLEGIFENGIKK